MNFNVDSNLSSERSRLASLFSSTSDTDNLSFNDSFFSSEEAVAVKPEESLLPEGESPVDASQAPAFSMNNSASSGDTVSTGSEN